MAKALKKLKKPVAIQTGPYWVTTGTPGSQSDPIPAKTEERARELAKRAFTDLKVWCSLHNKAGLDVIERACVEISGLPINSTPNSVSHVVDEHTNLTVTVKIWRK